MTRPSWSGPPPAPVAPAPILDLDSMLLGAWVRDRLRTISYSSPRALQPHLGPSEIGQACPRRLAYRIVGTPVVNHPDPLKSMIGTGFHLSVADGLKRLDGGVNRYLVEHKVSYRDIAGSVDLHDRIEATTFDWKTTTKNRIGQYRRDGPPTNYVVQAAIYAEGLKAQGEKVERIALAFIPRDGTLAELWVWTTEPDQVLADEWIDRYLEIKRQAEANGPGSLSAKPSGLCGYCPNHRPGSTDVALACPGKEGKA